MNASRDNFGKFENYLELAIKAIKKRGSISAKWKQVEAAKEISMTPIYVAIEVNVPYTFSFPGENNCYEVVANGNAVEEPSGVLFLSGLGKIVNLNDINIRYLEDGNASIEFLNETNLELEGEKILWNNQILDIRKNSPTAISQIGTPGEINIKKITYDAYSNQYTVVAEGVIDPQKDLIVDSNRYKFGEWKLSMDLTNSIVNGSGTPISIKKRRGNLLFINKVDFQLSDKLFFGDELLRYKKIDFQDPHVLIIDSKKVFIHLEGQRRFIYDDLPLKTTFTAHDPLDDNYLYEIKVKEERKDSSSLWIELQDEEEDESEQISARTSLDYFFEDDVRELEGRAEKGIIKFAVLLKNIEFRRVKISSLTQKNLNYEDIPKNLSIPANTYQLNMQKRAIMQLRQRPLYEQKHLLTLTEKKERNNPWQYFESTTVTDWKVLKDENRDGTIAQRKFVEKALNTPDFALLEGPPGSGKTTAILELIIQLIQNNKKVLLCASTHVAIDNVLERLKEQNLMEGILPLRIGEVNRVAETIKEFSIETIEKNKYKGLIIDAANLVCGTTIGILKHPLFQDKSGSKNQPKEPLYDYLIIDESSKTTFQEFLVPSLFAKKWVLVGDIKQLSPFSEPEYIISSLDAKLKPFQKQAALIIFHYLFDSFSTNVPICIVHRDEVIEEIRDQINKHTKDDFKKNVGFLFEELHQQKDIGPWVDITIEDCLNGAPISWNLFGLQILLVKESELNQVEPYIPSHLVIINRRNWEGSEHLYRQMGYYGKNENKFTKLARFRGKETVLSIEEKIEKVTLENNTYLKEKTWAGEYTWRMIRVHELENARKRHLLEKFEGDLKHLVPNNLEYSIAKDIATIKDIALPSILESLQTGVGKKRDRSYLTVLNSGFPELVLKSRYEQLDYQHRMHPEISEFPRKQFYDNQALKDSKTMLNDRGWTYKRYSARNMWIDVKNTRATKSTNEAEVRALRKELELFVNWTKTQSNKVWKVACLTFYNGQAKLIRDMLRKYTGNKNSNSNFKLDDVEILLYTVDKFQGREADITFLSMVQTNRDGFMDNPNRLNVAITRARFQLVILGDYNYFSTKSKSEHLRDLAISSIILEQDRGKS